MSFRFKLDENIPRDAAILLRIAGHDVHTAIEENLGGSDDPAVMEACDLEDRILVTLDLDFSDVRLYPPAGHNGVWVLRPGTQSIDAMLALISGALRLLATESVQNRLWVIEPGHVRIRE